LHYRTDKKVKTKWQNMQTSAKKQYADRKKYATQTGGGPPAKKLSNETETIVDMMKDCSSFVGLQGCESSFIGSVMQAERINLDSSVFPNRDLSAVGHRIGEFATQCGHIFLHQLLK
jgi:hypothetical protein